MNFDKLVITQFNISSLRNKITSLSTMIKNNVDMLLISETKIDSSFPTVQFHIDGYTIYRRGKNKNDGGSLLYIRDDVPSTLLNINPNLKAFYVKLNIRKKRIIMLLI